MRILLALALITSTSPGLAQIVDGGRALKECEAEDKTAIYFFVAGVADTSTNDKQALVAKSLQYSMATTPIPAELTKGILKEMHTFCLKTPVDPEQLRVTVCGYLKANPTKLNLSAAGLATQALQSAYPCKAG
ncbi:MAG: Rap1a/Tai family immunity protein [Afipia sp.]|nr:Rap1a/Tai family immunity protein [Afipia sp.]